LYTIILLFIYSRLFLAVCMHVIAVSSLMTELLWIEIVVVARSILYSHSRNIIVCYIFYD
jgi:hypothetical protein